MQTPNLKNNTLKTCEKMIKKAQKNALFLRFFCVFLPFFEHFLMLFLPFLLKKLLKKLHRLFLKHSRAHLGAMV